MSAALPMQGRTVLMTGATSGIGEVAACRLAEQGARIVFIARDRERAEHTLARLNELAPEQGHAHYQADLSLVSQTRQAAGQIAAREPPIDVLVNNAGALFSSRQLTSEGLERTFATNHLSYFVLTNSLLGRLSEGARVLCTSSHAHFGSRINFDDLQSANRYRGFEVYGRSKLMNLLFARQLARRLAGSGVTVNSLHPGFVATRFGDASGGTGERVLRLAKRFALTPEQGAETLIYLASSPEVARTSGAYFYRGEAVAPSPQAERDADAQRLWTKSSELSGVGA